MAAGKKEESIKRIQQVGEGSFGVVYIGSYREHKEVGIKDVKGKISDEAVTEANILKKLTHPNIVQYIDIVKIRNQTSIIMEFIDNGSLYNYIERTAQSSAYWRTTRQIMIDVAYGMSYLHGERIVHADLKSLNVLLRHDYRAVICDFGLARTIADSQTVATCHASGTELWFAPELCFEKPERSSFQSDVWAFGCVLLEIISKKVPWDDVYQSNRALLNALAKPENTIIFENICLTQRAPEKLRAILCHCCTWQKAGRPTFPSIVRDLSAISDIDLQNINQGKEKQSSSSSSTNKKQSQVKSSSSSSLPLPKIDHDEFKSVLDSVAGLALENSKPKRKPSAKCSTNDSGNQSMTEGNVKYDPVHNRQLYKGPRGGWYYLASNGNKIYLKTDSV